MLFVTGKIVVECTVMESKGQNSACVFGLVWDPGILEDYDIGQQSV